MATILVPSRRSDLLAAVGASAVITGLWFCLTWRYGFDLSDEGFYWYGAQRNLFGEMPIGDFQSYDIGRYYWTAAFMGLLGDDGVLGARVAAVAFQAVGTAIGVFLCLFAFRRRGTVRWPFALLAACVFTIWVWPYYKVFDHGTSVLIVAMLVLMLEFPRTAVWLGA